jgi:hypothetical protein
MCNFTVKGQCHEMDIFWRSNHLNQWSLSMVSKIFPKLVPTIYNCIRFICFLEITYTFWKCLLKASAEFPSLWLVDVLHCRPAIGCRKMRRIYLPRKAITKICTVSIFRVARKKIKLLLWFYQQQGSKKWWKLSAHIQHILLDIRGLKNTHLIS